jgi:signal transduction histidine kinase
MATNPSCAIIEGLPIAAALLSQDGSLLCANTQFRSAVGLDDAGRASAFAEALQMHLVGSAPEWTIPLRTGRTVANGKARRLDGGKILVWIDPPLAPIQERRTEFLGIASHDLRGSIANSRSYASLLLSPRMELGEKARHCAEVIQRNADRALRLLGECFDLFLHEQQALDLDRTPEDLTAVLGEAVDRARALATLRGVRLVAQVPPQLPATSVDRGRLVQAVLAFAAHSIARAGKGQPVRFEVRKQNDSIRVEVSDEEESASPRDAGLFYDAEARAIAEGRLGEGFRLGLARATIEAHGGEVGARSSLATGSTFYFTLPLS